jgi:hypothetical protein
MKAYRIEKKSLKTALYSSVLCLLVKANWSK